MKAKDIVVGGRYAAKVSGKLTWVRVTGKRETTSWGGAIRTVYDVVNERTGRRTVFHSAGKFRQSYDEALAKYRERRAEAADILRGVA